MNLADKTRTEIAPGSMGSESRVQYSTNLNRAIDMKTEEFNTNSNMLSNE